MEGAAVNELQILIGVGGTVSGMVLLYLTASILQEISLNPEVSLFRFFHTSRGMTVLRIMTGTFALYAVGMLIAVAGVHGSHPRIDEVSKLLAGSSVIGFILFQYQFLVELRNHSERLSRGTQ